MEFGRIIKVLNEDGTVKYRKAYVTRDVTLAKGDSVYLNEIEDSLENKVKYNIITTDEKVAKLAQIREQDGKFNRETTHVLRKAKPKAE
jgi:restriction endonuclease S subunit